MVSGNEDLYSTRWFQERALNSLEKMEDGVWDYSDSLLLYIPGTETEYETMQQGDDPYANLVTKPESEYLKKIADDIVKQLPNEFEYIDLGPGTAHKEQFIFDAAKKTNKKFVYRPVDISKYYLDFAAEHASKQGISAVPIQSSFEELAEKLGPVTTPRFVSLGLTFSNYHPKKILTLLKEVAGENGNVFIVAQIRERVDMNAIVSLYKNIDSMAYEKLKLLGADVGDIEQEVDDGIRVWGTMKNADSKLKELGVQVGDRLLMMQSLRYSKENFEKELQKTNSHFVIFDTEDPFIGAMIKS